MSRQKVIIFFGSILIMVLFAILYVGVKQNYKLSLGGSQPFYIKYFLPFFKLENDLYVSVFGIPNFTPPTATNQLLREVSSDEAPPAYEITNEYQSDIKDRGMVSGSKRFFIFETVKRQGELCNSDGSIASYYIADEDNTYTKRIFSYQNNRYDHAQLEFKAVEDGFQVQERLGRQPNELKKYYFVDYNGNKKPINKLDEDSVGLESPDKKYTLIQDRNVLGNPHIIKIKNNKSNEIFTLEIDNGMNGVYVDSWTPDSKYFYVVGGLYEFSAPAKLWRYDVTLRKLEAYPQLEGLVHPVTVFPEYGYALMSDKGLNIWNSDGNETSSLYKLNMNSGNLQKVFSERGVIGPIFNIFLGKAYYHVYQNLNNENQSSDIKSIDLKTLQSSVVKKDASLAFRERKLGSDFFPYKSKNGLEISSFSNPSKVWILDTLKPENCQEFTPEKEYFSQIKASSY